MTLNLKRIKAERIAKGMTQDEMAEAMGFESRGPYAKRENGIVGIGADELAEISEILDIPLTKMHIFFTNNVPEKERLVNNK